MTEEQYLVPSDEYLRTGIHIGTKFKTAAMQSFIYKIRPDGLNVLNLQRINDRLNAAARLLSQYDPENVLLICRRENGWQAVQEFSKYTGIKTFTKRYPPGILTNISLRNFMETKLIFATDPFPDKNAVDDAVKIGIPVIALCDTNNELDNIDLVVPCNNKGKKSIGLVFWILAREYLKLRGIIKDYKEFKATLDDFAPE